jgi:hypothetical protein
MLLKLSALAQRALVATLILWTSFGATVASAGRERVTTNGITDPTNGLIDAATPEPAAALVFAVGLGVIAWSVRSRRRD